LVVVLSLIFWGWLWGPVGALLSVPLTMVLKIILENTPDLRWAAVLLDKVPPQAREAEMKASTVTNEVRPLEGPAKEGGEALDAPEPPGGPAGGPEPSRVGG